MLDNPPLSIGTQPENHPDQNGWMRAAEPFEQAPSLSSSRSTVMKSCKLN
jgi:hypothetical protein